MKKLYVTNAFSMNMLKMEVGAAKTLSISVISAGEATGVIRKAQRDG